MKPEQHAASGAKREPRHGFRFAAATAVTIFVLGTIVALGLGGYELTDDTVRATLFGAALLSVSVPPLVYVSFVRPVVVSARERAAALFEARHENEALAAKLAEAQERLAKQDRILDNHIMLCETDLDGRFTFVNAEFCRVSGYGAGELIGSTHLLLTADCHPTEEWREMESIVASTGVWRADLCCKAKDGTQFHVRTTSIPLRNETGGITGYVSMSTENTQAVERELKLKRTQAQLFEKAAKAKAESLAKSNLLADMSRELRTPLNGIVGALDILRSTGLRKSQLELVDVSKHSAEALVCHLDYISQFTRMEAEALDSDGEIAECEQNAAGLEAPADGEAGSEGPEMASREQSAEALPSIVEAHFTEMKVRLEEALAAMWSKSLVDFKKVALAVSGACAGDGLRRLREISARAESPAAAEDASDHALAFSEELARMAAIAEAQFARREDIPNADDGFNSAADAA